jgi:hypothetical protein
MLIGVPTGYLVAALIASSLNGIVNVGGYDGGETAVLVVLSFFPLVVWVVAYGATRHSFQRQTCAALLATALTLPVALCALVGLIAVTGPFF